MHFSTFMRTHTCAYVWYACVCVCVCVRARARVYMCLWNAALHSMWDMLDVDIGALNIRRRACSTTAGVSASCYSESEPAPVPTAASISGPNKIEPTPCWCETHPT